MLKFVHTKKAANHVVNTLFLGDRRYAQKDKPKGFRR